MTAIVNGMAAYGGLKPFGATFFVFNDYCKPALRLAALMGLPSMFVFSHDSFYVGEDGPTHEPIEQIESLRTMPNVDVYRPADANETGACLALMLMRDDGPSCILTTRQNLPVLADATPEKVMRGGYVLLAEGPQDERTVLFVATGSEVHLCVAEAGVAKGLMEFAVAPATTRYLSLEHFGASGPYARLADEFGFTPANCLRLARELL